MLSSLHSRGFQISNSETALPEHPKWRLSYFQEYFQRKSNALTKQNSLYLAFWPTIKVTTTASHFDYSVFFSVFKLFQNDIA